MTKFIIALTLITSLFLQSCGTFMSSKLYVADPYTIGLDKFNEITLPEQRQGSLNFIGLTMDGFAMLILVGFVFLAIDIETGRLYNEKLADVVDTSITMDEITNSPYAYVITKSEAVKTQWTNTKVRYNDTYNFNNKITTYSKYSIVRINPGRYTMTAFNYVNNSRAYYMDNYVKNDNEKLKNTTPRIGYFEVEAGKIYYLGSLVTNPHNHSFTMDVINDRKNMLKVIQKEYAQLANKDNLIIDNIIKLNPKIITP